MYIPPSFLETDPIQRHDLMEQHSFATLNSSHEGEPVASHLSTLLDRGSPAAILHDAMVCANASGGPLVDLDGKVVAINVADRHPRNSDDNIASNIAVPAADVQRIVGELRAKQDEK